MKQGDVTALVCGVNEDKKKTEEEQKELADKNYSFIEKSVTVSSDEITDLIKQKKYKEALEKIGNEVKQLNEKERPREKALLNGIKSLSNRELIALLLRSGTREKSALEVADELLCTFETMGDWEVLLYMM